MMPSIRSIGGAPAVICKSEAFFSNINRKRVSTLTIKPGLLYLKFRSIFVSVSYAEQFFNRRHTLQNLLNAAFTQGLHSAFTRDFFKLRSRLSLNDRFTEFIGQDHDFMDSHTAFVSGVRTGLTTFAVVQGHW